MNIYLIIILSILGFSYLLNSIVEYLNIKNLKKNLPKEFDGFYDENKYRKSQQYLKENTIFSSIQESFEFILIIFFIVFGGFNFLDSIIRNYNFPIIITGIIFTLSLILLFGLLKLPFSIYSTFVIEEKYDFNKTTVKTFIFDILKSLLLLLLIGIPLLLIILWFFEKSGNLAWLYLWGIISIFQIILMYIAPILIMPLFNKYIPLEEGELKTTIENYAKNQNFKLKGVFKMDGSKRSSKSNAFFTGFGNSKRIVLFDTLIEKHTVSELLSVIAHEMGHYKLKHIYKGLILSFMETGLLLFILSKFLNNTTLFEAFKMQHISIYASLLFFGFLYSPIGFIISIFVNFFQRKHEFQADKYAVETLKDSQNMILALKKLSVDNLSNLTPHPLKVFLEYSHPPVLERINYIKNLL